MDLDTCPVGSHDEEWSERGRHEQDVRPSAREGETTPVFPFGAMGPTMVDSPTKGLYDEVPVPRGKETIMSDQRNVDDNELAGISGAGTGMSNVDGSAPADGPTLDTNDPVGGGGGGGGGADVPEGEGGGGGGMQDMEG
jgi:hypothetical protein